MIIIATDLHFGNQGSCILDQQWFVNFLYFHKTSLDRVILAGDTIEEWMGIRSWKYNKEFQRLQKLGNCVKIDLLSGNYPHDCMRYLLNVKSQLKPLNIIVKEIELNDFIITHGSQYDPMEWWYNNVFRLFNWFLLITKLIRSLPSKIVQTPNRNTTKRIKAIHVNALNSNQNITMGHTHSSISIEKHNVIHDLGSVGMPGIGSERIAIFDDGLKFQNVPKF